MCCSSEYMFLYAQELLFATEIALQSHSTLKRKLNLNNDEEHGEIKNKKGYFNYICFLFFIFF